jgi:hypothetical protein
MAQIDSDIGAVSLVTCSALAYRAPARVRSLPLSIFVMFCFCLSCHLFNDCPSSCHLLLFFLHLDGTSLNQREMWSACPFGDEHRAVTITHIHLSSFLFVLLTKSYFLLPVCWPAYFDDRIALSFDCCVCVCVCVSVPLSFPVCLSPFLYCVLASLFQCAFQNNGSFPPSCFKA